jgi:preprotein translocase subunit Sec61beta
MLFAISLSFVGHRNNSLRAISGLLRFYESSDYNS